jgi:hypothetical protein
MHGSLFLCCNCLSPGSLSPNYETCNDAHVTSWHTYSCIKTDIPGWIPRKVKNFNPLGLLHDEHIGAEHHFIFPIYPARNNTKIITQSQYT